VRDYLTVPEALSIRESLTARYGGTPGVRDLEALEAALNRPLTMYYDDVAAEAAALWQSLSEEQVFFDGNKRTAFALVYTFLLINGVEMRVREEDAYQFVVELYQAQAISSRELAERLRCHIVEE